MDGIPCTSLVRKYNITGRRWSFSGGIGFWHVQDGRTTVLGKVRYLWIRAIWHHNAFNVDQRPRVNGPVIIVHPLNDYIWSLRHTYGDQHTAYAFTEPSFCIPCASRERLQPKKATTEQCLESPLHLLCAPIGKHSIQPCLELSSRRPFRQKHCNRTYLFLADHLATTLPLVCNHDQLYGSSKEAQRLPSSVKTPLGLQWIWNGCLCNSWWTYTEMWTSLQSQF